MLTGEGFKRKEDLPYGNEEILNMVNSALLYSFYPIDHIHRVPIEIQLIAAFLHSKQQKNLEAQKFSIIICAFPKPNRDLKPV